MIDFDFAVKVDSKPIDIDGNDHFIAFDVELVALLKDLDDVSMSFRIDLQVVEVFLLIPRMLFEQYKRGVRISYFL